LAASVFAEFEREILRERVCAGLAHAGSKANASAARHRRRTFIRVDTRAGYSWRRAIMGSIRDARRAGK